MTPTPQVRTIPLLDLNKQYLPLREELLRAITAVLDSQRFIMGDDVKLLEQEIAAYCHADFAIACASGSDALMLALLALSVGRGDKVLTTPYTFFATAGAIHRVGAIPVFADIQESDFNIAPAAIADQLRRHPDIKAIIPVHLFGACADMEAISAMAAQHGVRVIEDSAQAIGAEVHGRRTGTLGDVACFSFFPSKNLGAAGDGGILTTNNPALAAKLSSLRVHGAKRKYLHEDVGVNSRLDTIQAAILRVKLRHLDRWTAGRQRNAGFYRRRLSELGIPVTLPAPPPAASRHVYNQFVICGERRDELQNYLKECGIGSEIYYPRPMHLQECFQYLGYKKGDFPVSEKCAERSLAIPIYSELSESDLEHICQTISQFYN